MKGRMETELGSILIDTDVIATYAGSVAVECFGIVGGREKSGCSEDRTLPDLYTA